MTNLTTTNLKCLLEKATAAPWTVEDDGYDIIIGNAEGHRMGWGDQVRFKFEAGDKKHDPQLAALAPELAREVIRLREELIDWANDEARAHNALVKRAQEAGGAGIVSTHKTIYNRIWEILGDHDE